MTYEDGYDDDEDDGSKDYDDEDDDGEDDMPQEGFLVELGEIAAEEAVVTLISETRQETADIFAEWLVSRQRWTSLLRRISPRLAAKRERVDAMLRMAIDMSTSVGLPAAGLAMLPKKGGSKLVVKARRALRRLYRQGVRSSTRSLFRWARGRKVARAIGAGRQIQIEDVFPEAPAAVVEIEARPRQKRGHA